MINVIGLGYIGLPTALMMASHGVEVIGTDYNKELVATLNAGHTTFKEDGLDELFQSYFGGQLAEGASAHHFAAAGGEEAFGLVGVFTEQIVADHSLKNGVAEKLEPLVVVGALDGVVVVLAVERLVAQGQAVDVEVAWPEAKHVVERNIKFLLPLRKEEPVKLLQYVHRLDETDLFFVLLYNDTGIVSAETEGVAQCGAHGALLCLVEGEVKFVVDVGVFVAFLMVDGGRHDVFLHGHEAEEGFHGSGCAEQVTRHGLGGADVELVGMLAEHFLNGFHFGNVAHGSGGAVHIDVVDVFGLHAGVAEGFFHHDDGSEAFGM